MIFSSIFFIWIFLPLILGGNFITQKFAGNYVSNILLLISSLFFYAWGEPVYVVILLFSIIVNWSGGVAISVFKKWRRIILIGIIIINLSLLIYFKYTVMIIMSLNQFFGRALDVPQIALPVGISFFTFQAISYVIDIYRGNCSVQKNIINIGLYLSFFPQLIAGPIVKYKDIEEQLERRRYSIEKTASGIRRFSYGFAKKVLIANVLAASVDKIYSLELSDVTGIMAWAAALMYTFQIYYDFSGYSDMAIGLGRMFGFEFQENFNYPYITFSIREFWRKWHISLSTWFKEYIYIPLGGSRKGTYLTCRNLLIVFFFTGLWHGSSWNYVLWGLYHGIFIILERIVLEKIIERHKCISWIYTFLLVNFGWVLFRITNIKSAWEYVKRMILPWLYTKSDYMLAEFVNMHTVFIFVCSIMGMGVIQKICSEKIKAAWIYSYTEIIYGTILLLYSIVSLAANTYNPFIYFRF